MYTKKKYSGKDLLMWTRIETLLFISIAIVEVLIFDLSEAVVQIPFTPVALVGTAVAFIISFHSNSAYSRIWEARKIWGAIAGASKTFAMQIDNFINNDHSLKPESKKRIKEEIKTLIYRHIAWLTALRYAMRQPRPWEHVLNEHTNKEWANKIYVPEIQIPFKTAIEPYLSQKELEHIQNYSNKATSILFLQLNHLRKLKKRGLIWEFSFLELEKKIEELATNQGKSERIKNFPYPRQFASILHYFTWIFVFILPLGIVGQFENLGGKLEGSLPSAQHWFLWVSVPFSVIIMWIFHTMNRIGRVGENPFEGFANDVPISTIARSIEIDLLQNIGEPLDKIPKQFEARNDTQM